MYAKLSLKNYVFRRALLLNPKMHGRFYDQKQTLRVVKLNVESFFILYGHLQQKVRKK